jgi:hypothetical protein
MNKNARQSEPFMLVCIPTSALLRKEKRERVNAQTGGRFVRHLVCGSLAASTPTKSSRQERRSGDPTSNKLQVQVAASVGYGKLDRHVTAAVPAGWVSSTVCYLLAGHGTDRFSRQPKPFCIGAASVRSQRAWQKLSKGRRSFFRFHPSSPDHLSAIAAQRGR